MKKIYTLLFLCFSVFTLQAQYVVDFENETKGGYPSATVALSGLDWDMTEALIGTLAADWKNGAKSARMRGHGTSSMTMLANKTNGLGTLSFQYRRYGTDVQVDWRVEYSINNGASWIQIGSDFTAPATDAVQTFSEVVNINADIRIRIKRATETGTSNNRLNIDDIVLTDFGAAASPTLSIGSPSNGTVFAPNGTITVNFTVGNFVVGPAVPGVDGHIHYTLSPGGSMVMKFDTNPIVFEGLSAGQYSLFMELVDNNHQPLNPAVGVTVTFEVATLNVVNNLAAMRADVIANGPGKFYQINSQPVVTYARATRNQKYVQDATAAVLIDDVDGIIPNTYNIGDAMSGLTGRTSLFSGLLQFTPSANASLASTGNNVVPQVVTLSDLIDNLESYESELVQINNVTFADGDGTNVFVSPPNTNYAFTNGTETVNFRTLFAEANYIGSLIPVGPTSFAALVGNFNGAPQVTARSSNDLTLSIRNNSIEGLKIYPNPVTDGILYISTPANADKSISVYDVLGKEVLTTTTSYEAVNVSGLMKGIYMVRITENSKTATLKLVIR
ncbi:MAG: T9SS type A sorting domain-containing protein [Flavobacterium sp.]